MTGHKVGVVMSLVEPGTRFGRLEVQGPGPVIKRGPHWICRCDCGSTVNVPQEYLRGGRTNSCGCLRREITGNKFRQHGMSRSRRAEHQAWVDAKARTSDPNNSTYPDYGGRGIDMEPRLASDFSAFLAEVGLKPGKSHSLDRIDNNKGYWSGNIRWATSVQQHRNKRGIKIRDFDIPHILAAYPSYSISAIATRYGVCYTTIWKIVRGHSRSE